MKYLVFLFIMMIFSCKAPTPEMTTAPDSSLLAESEKFSFHNPFWLNMHHYLHHKVLHRDTSQLEVFEKKLLEQLSSTEKEIARQTADFYKEELVELDLRTSDYMAAFKDWAVRQEAAHLRNIPDSFQPHTDHLTAFAPVYRQYVWPEHAEANHKILDEHLPLIRQLETRISRQLEQWTQTNWQAEKIRIDITYYAKSYRGYERDRPFTTLHPTHVVMNAGGHQQAGNWIELLFHESSHHLITPRSGAVSETLARVAEELQQPLPRSLWHAYLFYFSGKACQEALRANGIPDYELYMVRNRVFGRYLPYLDQYLPDYLEAKTSLSAASKQIISAFYEDQH